ncbi:MAG: nitrate ABC transporter substrate-binding protein, partial [Gammaproteobacteria bacterium]|nr:nitrate ABC transporter substrate-binding protein [Gammaproteobacteria bacterium]
DFNVFFRYNATYPFYSDAVWYLTQMRRWGQVAEQKPDSWYMDIAKKVYRPDIYSEAASELIAEGKMSAGEFPDFAKEDGFRAPQTHFIDGITYDGHKPNDYLKNFDIGLKGKEKI